MNAEVSVVSRPLRQPLAKLRNRTCRRVGAIGILAFSLKMVMTARDEFDPLAPQREAAFFYGLFLRGHDVAGSVCVRRPARYRKQVLAIFDGLVLNEQNQPRLQ